MDYFRAKYNLCIFSTPENTCCSSINTISSSNSSSSISNGSSNSNSSSSNSGGSGEVVFWNLAVRPHSEAGQTPQPGSVASPGSDQTPTGLRLVLHHNTETLSSAVCNWIPASQSHVLHLSKTIKAMPNVGRDRRHSPCSQPRKTTRCRVSCTAKQWFIYYNITRNKETVHHTRICMYAQYIYVCVDYICMYSIAYAKIQLHCDNSNGTLGGEMGEKNFLIKRATQQQSRRHCGFLISVKFVSYFNPKHKVTNFVADKCKCSAM